ncbi:MAG: ATP-grasp domain-containing protein [Sulfurospirillum cavolei]|nr:ATP-grasp domain-containing protein [Sulfurospirillum cavolei]
MNLLVTSINAKIPLLACVRDAIHQFDATMQLFGSDCDEGVLGRYFVDQFWHMPRLDTLTCKEFLEYCQKHRIGFIIPTRDHDVLFLAHHKDMLEEAGITCFLSSFSCVQTCYDKLAFAHSSASLHLIPTQTHSEALSCERFVVKERFGAGSRSLLLDATQKDALAHAKKLQAPIFQPYIVGQEYSVDSYMTQQGACIGSIVRIREKIVNGESKVTVYAPNDAITTVVETLLCHLGLRGHSVTQLIVNDEGIFIIECNARFGGASTLSYRMGLHSFLWFLQESAHRPITFTLNTEVTRLVRVEQDLYFAH